MWCTRILVKYPRRILKIISCSSMNCWMVNNLCVASIWFNQNWKQILIQCNTWNKFHTNTLFSRVRSRNSGLWLPTKHWHRRIENIHHSAGHQIGDERRTSSNYISSIVFLLLLFFFLVLFVIYLQNYLSLSYHPFSM